MIHYLAMNVTQNFNMFPAKIGVLDRPHMILSHRNWYYNKHPKVEFCAYVQASQVNFPKNNNCSKILDQIYLCPTPNFQGGHHIMDLRTGKLITIPKTVEINIIYVVINAVEKWRRSKDLMH